MSEEEIRILKTESCPSLSGRSLITYNIGSKENVIYIQLFGNSEKGLFSKIWLTMERIHQLLATDQQITSKTLKVLYAEQSVNSMGFLMAVLCQEKLITQIEEKSRKYMSCDTAEFNKAIQPFLNCDTEKPPLKTTKPMEIKQKSKTGDGNLP
jgi:hypothetical protein